MVLTTDMLDDGILTGHEVKEDSLGEMEVEAVDPATLHELLVKHVLEVSGELDSRLDVWGEHSYARARGAAANSQIRVLLSPPEPEPEADEVVDVVSESRPPPAPPLDGEPGGEDEDAGEDEDEDDEWEERLMELAPSSALRRLAAAALCALRDLRLARLAARGGGGRWARRERAAAAARRLRHVLAPHWAGGAAWLHAALLAGLPRALAPLYAEVLAELRRQVPRLAARLPAPRDIAPLPDPLAVVGEARSASAPGPWLAWAPSGSAAEDERWLRRLAALLHARPLRAPVAAARAPPARWCAALAHEARGALAGVLADAGRRAVLVGGAGAGAALAAWLAAGAARARGLLLLAPPLLTAEGPRDSPEDILEEVNIPLLAVVGGGAAQCWRGAAAELACRGEAGGGAGGGAGGATRRVLVLAGADDALRLPRAHRLRLRLPQHALDAAIAEECARWAQEAAEWPEPAPRDRAAARRKGTSTGLESEDIRPSPTGSRSIEIIEGRVAPRAPPALAAADIMQLPIVFADDEPPAPPAGPPAAPCGPPARAAGPPARAAGPPARAAGPPAPPVGPPARAAGPPAAPCGPPARGAGQFRYTRVLVAKRPPALLRRRAAHAPHNA